MDFAKNQIYKRTDIHDKVGGQRQGGISTPSNSPFILLFTSEAGGNYGYQDGWNEESQFLYTGEGQVGDMNDIINTQKVGWIIDGQPDKIVKQILKEWKDQEAWQEKKQRCFKVANSIFSWGQCLEKYIHIYSKLDGSDLRRC